MATITPPTSTPPGWYPDPWGQHEHRYWDGSQWTGATEDNAPPIPPRRRRWPMVVIATATAAAAALAAASFGEGREKLALVAVLLVAPLAAANIQRLVSASATRRRPLGLALAAWIVVVSIVAVGGYRGFHSTSCADALGPNAKVSGCKLAGRDLTKFDLHGADLSNADLAGADLANVDLTSANLSGAALHDADLTAARLDSANLSGVELDGTKLDSASAAYATFANTKLHNVSAHGANFSSADLTAADVAGSDFTGAFFDGAKLEGSTIRDTILSSATFSGAVFSNTTLGNVTLDGALLEGAVDLSDAALAGAFAVDPLDVAKTLSDRGLFLESDTATQSAVAAACSGTPVPGSAASPSNGSFVVIVNQGSTTFTWPTAAPALRFVELVACVGSLDTVDVDQCGPYFYEDGSLAHPITRYRESMKVRLVNPATAAVVAERTFDGPEPDACPFSVSSSVYTLGNPLDTSAVEAGVSEMVTAAGV